MFVVSNAIALAAIIVGYHRVTNGFSLSKGVRQRFPTKGKNKSIIFSYVWEKSVLVDYMHLRWGCRVLIRLQQKVIRTFWIAKNSTHSCMRPLCNLSVWPPNEQDTCAIIWEWRGFSCRVTVPLDVCVSVFNIYCNDSQPAWDKPENSSLKCPHEFSCYAPNIFLHTANERSRISFVRSFVRSMVLLATRTTTTQRGLSEADCAA